MIKRAIVLFTIIAALVFLQTWYFDRPTDSCSFLPEYLRSNRMPKEWLEDFNFRSDFDVFEADLTPDELQRREELGLPCVLSHDVVFAGLGYPTFYLTKRVGGHWQLPPTGFPSVFYPQFLLVNIAWIAAASIGLAGLWELRKRRRRTKPATPETPGGIAQP